jgi:outer membrane protein TolC
LNSKFIYLYIVTILLFSGCTPLGPDFKALDKPTIPKELKRGSGDEKILKRWWRVFGDNSLNKLIEIAYQENLDVKSAGLRIVQARAILGISEGYLYPQQQTLSGSAVSTKNGKNEFASANIGFDVGWEMDFWGKYARGVESSEADLYRAVASYQDILVSILSEVARNYIDYRTAQERIAYAKRNIAIQKRICRLTEVQFNAGNVSELDMQQALSQLHNTKAILPLIEIEKSRSLNAMALLLATNRESIERIVDRGNRKLKDPIKRYMSKNSRNILQIKQSSRDILNVDIIPKAKFNPYYKIDANLITRRPDIKVAEYIVRSNSANIGSTIAELYPSFVLFGNISISPNSALGSWSSGTDALGVNIGPSFSWNILQYGRIKNKIRAKDAIFEESIVNYNKQVLLAINEISNAIVSYKYSKEQQLENSRAVEATIRAFNISVVQYNDGLVGYERLLTTVETLTRTQDQYAQIKGNLSKSVILLYKALGGGWQISKGKSYISKELAEKMKGRIDWGRYLDKSMTKIPESLE